jgi:superfamily II DNA or RNA helicase
MIHLTEKMLLEWAGQKKYLEARQLLDRETVSDLEIDPPLVRGTLNNGSRSLRTGFRVVSPTCVESLCPCYDNRERGIICSHVVALAIEVRRRSADPYEAERREAERRRTAQLAAIPEGAYLRRAKGGNGGGVVARIEAVLPADWPAAWASGRVPVECLAAVNGRRVPLDQVPRDLALVLSPKDEALLFVLEDIGGGPRGRIDLGRADFLNLIEVCAGRPIPVAGGGPPVVVHTETRVESRIRLVLDAQTGEIDMTLHSAVPGPAGADAVVHLVHRHKGWAGTAAALWRLARILPEPLHGAYAHGIRIPRLAVPRFLGNEWPALAQWLPIETAISPELFSIEPARPGFKLVGRGSLASLTATLFAEYDGTSLVAGKADPAGQFAIPDPSDILRYMVRNPGAETDALRLLSGLGIAGEVGDRLAPLMGERAVLNFLGRHLPALRRRGWKVDIQGRAGGFLEQSSWATPVVKIAPTDGGRWFEVEFHFEDTTGVSLSPSDIRRALLKGESFVDCGGRPVLFDAGAVEAMQEVFEDCASADGSRPGSFRLAGVYASYVRESLHALDGVDIEADASWRAAVEKQSGRVGDAPVTIDPALQAFLRPYQREGVAWLRSLEQCGFAGILADEMGLGKTVQALAWLRMERLLPGARGRPALIVCPTSLIENWAEEAARFTPSLRVRIVAGLDRHERWDSVGEADLLITSYALLRRDLDRHLQNQFSVLVLDEAQHIKNRATRNAIAAKQIKAFHKLVLTGTPMENSVADLWSIMDFLMPGYLGSGDGFRRRYEQPIAQGGEACEAALVRLRRKLRPFLMRRMKRDVARELPPKIERIAHCTLTGDQQRVYKELLDSSRRRIADMVAERGFDASRMEILRTLLRLRQTCCHLGLLRMEGLQSEFPSAKMDLLFELLDEALDGGHRVLVFSQFVSMLTLLRAELDRRQWRHCYLDGATQDRLSVVKQFNGDRGIPVFLISLKAGGTGLNLVGADMVVHFDPWWNPAVENQATDRAYRIGQKRTVYSVKLIARDTVEERVVAMQRRKQQLIDAAIEAGGAPIQRMSWEDVKEILEM